MENAWLDSFFSILILLLMWPMSRIWVISSLTVYHGDELLRSWSWHWQAFQGERLVIQGTDGQTRTLLQLAPAWTFTDQAGLVCLLFYTKLRRCGSMKCWSGNLKIYSKKQSWILKRSREVFLVRSRELYWALLFFSPSTYSLTATFVKQSTFLLSPPHINDKTRYMCNAARLKISSQDFQKYFLKMCSRYNCTVSWISS